MRLAQFLPSKYILPGSSERKPWIKAGFGGVEWLGEVLRDGEGERVEVAGTGDPYEVSQKCHLCHKVYFVLAYLEKSFSPAKEELLFPLSSQPLNGPRVTLRGDEDGKAQVTGVEFR